MAAKLFNAILLSLVCYVVSSRKVCREQVDCATEPNNYDNCCGYGCCTLDEYNQQTCRYNYDCHKPTISQDTQYCCRHGCCDYEQYHSDSCTSNDECKTKNSTEIDALRDFYCCNSGCCTEQQYTSTTCKVHHDCPLRNDTKNKEFCCGDSCCSLEEMNVHLKMCDRDDDCTEEDADTCCNGICCEPVTGINVGGIIGILIAIFVVIIIAVVVAHKCTKGKGRDKNGDYQAGKRTTEEGTELKVVKEATQEDNESV